MEVFRETCEGFGDFGGTFGGFGGLSMRGTEGSGEQWFGAALCLQHRVYASAVPKGCGGAAKGVGEVSGSAVGGMDVGAGALVGLDVDSDGARVGSKQSRVHILPGQGDVH